MCQFRLCWGCLKVEYEKSVARLGCKENLERTPIITFV